MSAVGYLVALEWVGKLHASIISQPFFLGSNEHRIAVDRLCDHSFAKEFIDLRVDDVGVEVWPEQVASRPAVIWRTTTPLVGDLSEDSYFFKIIRGDGFDAPKLRQYHEVYAALQTAYADGADDLPAAIVTASLLYGAGELCVLMPWVSGRDASVGDLDVGGVAVAPVAEAITWLARRGLLYIDLREPNIRISEPDGHAAAVAGLPPPAVKLIDYDDCILITPPVSIDGLLELLAEHKAMYAAPSDSLGSRPAVIAALCKLWSS